LTIAFALTVSGQYSSSSIFLAAGQSLCTYITSQSNSAVLINNYCNGLTPVGGVLNSSCNSFPKTVQSISQCVQNLTNPTTCQYFIGTLVGGIFLDLIADASNTVTFFNNVYSAGQQSRWISFVW
jgi:hypothetical protein